MPHAQTTTKTTTIDNVELYVNDDLLAPTEVSKLRVSYPDEPLEELYQRYITDGYVFLRGLLPREDVLSARESYFTSMAPSGVLKPGAGFPDQRLITYLLTGGVDHEDFAGNRGSLSAGDLQFMTAGRGVVHSEMPRQNEDGSANVGLQLWVDLPANLKACEPRYRDLRAAEIPIVKVDDDRVTVKVISGQSHGVDSVKDLAYTPVWMLDIEIQPGGKITQPLPQGWNAFAYTLEGDVIVGKDDQRRVVEQFHNIVFEPEGDVVHFEVDAGASKPARLALVAGTPLDQPVVQYGPFVLTSKEEVAKALFDYQTFSNGFERAKDWESEIGKSMMR
ncbi:hypothetical protein NM208_g178 [Fusarium decemcellulare]|uniref:Uncharacterized protein n=1 Tax=Fusarium decemcellulare TaxID=57161 RepID=A0ACC1T0A3_9HYPO|nr:hypothetical protein NM208_g178 [Fusarium decemcellulare]